MAILDILEFPDSRLRTVAKDVTLFDEKLVKFVEDMFETMYEAPGIGLAASQVNRHERIVVIDVSEEHDEPLVFINPSLELSGEDYEYQEGCLSVPGFYEDVTRKTNVKVTAKNQFGEEFVLEADGLLAICIQHECDHLNGKLFVDYISSLKRTRIRKKLEKLHRQG